MYQNCIEKAVDSTLVFLEDTYGTAVYIGNGHIVRAHTAYPLGLAIRNLATIRQRNRCSPLMPNSQRLSVWGRYAMLANHTGEIFDAVCVACDNTSEMAILKIIRGDTEKLLPAKLDSAWTSETEVFSVGNPTPNGYDGAVAFETVGGYIRSNPGDAQMTQYTKTMNTAYKRKTEDLKKGDFAYTCRNFDGYSGAGVFTIKDGECVLLGIHYEYEAGVTYKEHECYSGFRIASSMLNLYDLIRCAGYSGIDGLIGRFPRSRSLRLDRTFDEKTSTKIVRVRDFGKLG